MEPFAGLHAPPPVPSATTDAMMHDPCRCDVAARTGPGVLWWVRRPMCGTPVCPWQALLSRAALLQCRCRRMCRKPGLDLGECPVPLRACMDVLHVDQEQDPTRMLERALNGARSCNHSSKPRAVVHRVIRDDVRVCQRDSSRSIDRTQLQCCRRERCVSVVEVIGKL